MKRPPEDRRERLYWFWRGFLLVLLRINNRFTSTGSENVPASGGCLIAANHASFLDPPAVGAGVSHRVVRFMARDTLFKGLFGWMLHRVCVIPMSREKGDLGALRKAIEQLKAGYCLGLFPEGTRSVDGQLQAPKSGIGFLVVKAGVPVVPAYVHGAFEAYPKGARWIRPGRVSITYGRPIMPADFAVTVSDRKSYDKLGLLIMERIAELAATVDK